MLAAFEQRRDLVAARLRALPGVRIPEIGGAFYAFFDIREPLGRMKAGGIETSMQWCEALLERQQVALVAGSAFGAEGHVRMSFAASEATLATGLDRIAAFLQTG
jgi:aspartate aminotransferase